MRKHELTLNPLQKHFKHTPSLYARPLPGYRGEVIGAGLFAARAHQAGEVVMRLDWSNAPESLVAWDDTEEIHQDRATAIAPGWYFCPTPDDPFWFLNHSCEPNVGYRNWAGIEERSGIPLVALRDIGVGEEVVVDYSMMTSCTDGMEEDVPWTMKCLCASKHCRGVLTDFISLPHSLQIDMMSMRKPVCGPVPAFILSESETLVQELRYRAKTLFEGFKSALASQVSLAKSLVEIRAQLLNKRGDSLPIY